MSVLLYATSAWAQTGTITYSISTYSSAGSFSSTQVWNSNGTPKMTMTYSGSNGYNTGNGRIFKGNYTLSVSGGYIITGYSITGHCAWNGSNGDVERITPATGTITDGDGNTVTYLDFEGSDVTLNVSGVNSQSVSFTMAQTTGTGNGAFDATAITITYQVDPRLAIPQLTTDLSSPKYYSIKSYDRGGYLSSNGSGQAMTHVDFKDGSVWYFTAADGNMSGNAMNGVIAHNFDGTAMTTSWQTSETGGTVYILPNGVNVNGFSISKTASISGSSCCDANNSNTGVGNYDPRDNDWKGTTWVIVPTIPSGYYYFKGMDTGRYPYLYSNFVGKGGNDTYHHSPLSGTNGEIWKVTNNGPSLSIINGEGLPLTIGTTTYETLNIGSVAEGPDFYFTQAINLTNSGNDTKLTTWIEGGSGATDNRWTFEAVDVSAGLYNVVIEGHANGYVTYNGQNAKNGGFFVAESIAEGDITVHEIDDYTSSVTIADNTITVVYTHTIDYTLTDANGAKYTGSYSGIVGEEPVFTGCVGYSLSDITWDGYSFTATINFPFAVSTSTFLGQFHNKNGCNSIDFLWHAESTGVVVHSGDMPNETTEEQNKYLWTIEPTISGLNITFAIKNVATDTYITSTETGNSHNQGAVTLSGTATPLQYQKSTTNNCGDIYVWYIPSTGKYLSVNSITGGAGSLLGVWNLAANHDGPSTGFHTYLDLIKRYWEKNEVSSKLANTGRYGYPATDNDYTVALNGMKTALDGGSDIGNATHYNNLRTWYAGFLAADKVVPTAGFYRLKSSPTWTNANLYLMGVNSTSKTTRAALYASNNDNYTVKGSTWYFDGMYMYNFSNGLPAVKDGGNMLGVATGVGAAATTIAFQKPATAELGSLNVKFATNRYLYANNGFTDAGGSASGLGYNWVVEDVTTLPVTISSAGYATLFAPVALTIPDGVTAYVATDEGEYLTLTAIEGGVIPAETGVILKGEAGPYDFAITDITTGGSAGSNALIGTVAAIIRPQDSYILSTGSSGVGFYADGAQTIPGFKSYLQTANPIRGFLGFNFDDPTSISAIEAAMNAGKAIYDLSGRRVENPVSGLYIVNGKKVFINKK